jgi:beta-galactosidase
MSERTPHFGAVYFRKANPPAEEWERDYRVAAEDGQTLFRHWFIWNAIEVAPGVYRWEDYDRQLDLAARYGIQTVIAEILDYPEWLYRQNPQARIESRDGTLRTSEMHVSCATGGHHSLCLDHPEVAEAYERFLTEMARHYRGHPALLGYDVWNECTFYDANRLCYCPATQARFRDWLRLKYGDIGTLGRAWHRHSLTDWDDVEMSRQVVFYPDVLDRIAFHNDNAFDWLRWRVDVLRRADPDHPVTAHGNARSFADIATACGDDYRAAKAVDLFGYTYWYGNRCDPYLAGDLIRCAARGKTFWRAEAVGDHDWLARDRVGSEPMAAKDRMHAPEAIRLDCMISLVAGASAYMTPRWRPLLDGPLFGAFGWYGMDGRRTERSAMIASLAAWANEERVQPLWDAAPVRGEVAIVLLDEAQAHCYARHGSTDFYSACVQGAYGAFLDANIQCDVIKLDAIDEYNLVYLPYPVALSDATIGTLRRWVEAGGCLVSEGCPGYFDERGHAYPTQPSRGLDALFGCDEADVAFAPDRYEWQELRTADTRLRASLYRQAYTPTTGTAMAWAEDDGVAAVRHHLGAGRTLLVGAMPGYAYHRWPDEGTRRWFASLPALAGRQIMARVNASDVVTRFWKGPSGRFLWVINNATADTRVTVESGEGYTDWTSIDALRGGEDVVAEGGRIRVTVPGRDAVVLRLI